MDGSSAEAWHFPPFVHGFGAHGSPDAVNSGDRPALARSTSSASRTATAVTTNTIAVRMTAVALTMDSTRFAFCSPNFFPQQVSSAPSTSVHIALATSGMGGTSTSAHEGPEAPVLERRDDAGEGLGASRLNRGGVEVGVTGGVPGTTPSAPPGGGVSGSANPCTGMSSRPLLTTADAHRVTHADAAGDRPRSYSKWARSRSRSVASLHSSRHLECMKIELSHLCP
eukprot:COSAG02_NODE_3990_length_5943_cov_3.596680_1_plen_226_part_00